VGTKTRKKKEIECACGCGGTLTTPDDRNRARTFINGHNGRNKHKARITTACRHCGSAMAVLQCRLDNGCGIFCSRKCRAAFTAAKLKNNWQYAEKMRKISTANGNKPPLHIKEGHWNWKGGISKPNRGQDLKYKKWRIAVLAVARYTCALCGKVGGRLSAHHKNSWKDFISLRYDISNGECLCYTCHMQLHGLAKKK
jgi:hypothetical protein